MQSNVTIDSLKGKLQKSPTFTTDCRWKSRVFKSGPLLEVNEKYQQHLRLPIEGAQAPYSLDHDRSVDGNFILEKSVNRKAEITAKMNGTARIYRPLDIDSTDEIDPLP